MKRAIELNKLNKRASQLGRIIYSTFVGYHYSIILSYYPNDHWYLSVITEDTTSHYEYLTTKEGLHDCLGVYKLFVEWDCNKLMGN